MKIPVIVDLEPGVEAYIPLLLLHSDPAYEIRAVTFSHRPESPEQSLTLKRLLTFLGGEAAADYESGLSAVSLMSRTVAAGSNTAIFVSGPLSNTATFLLTHPELKESLRCVSFAGGSFRGGDATPAAERNIYSDPEAADMVLRSGAKTFMTPLEFNAAALRPVLAQACGACLKLPEQVVRSLSFDRALRNISAALVIAHPELFQTRELYVEAELSGAFSRGATVADLKNQLERQPNVSALEGLDQEKTLPLLSTLLNSLGQEGVK